MVEFISLIKNKRRDIGIREKKEKNFVVSIWVVKLK